ncbi:MAG: altronate dehydratase family protein [Pirellulaceae bacterium]
MPIVASKSDFILLHQRDSVVVALRDLEVGETLVVGSKIVQVVNPVSAGHKLAVQPVAQDQPILKFGWPIGRATTAIAPGQHVHTHNVRCDHTIDLEAIATEIPEDLPALEGHHFDGFLRPSGKVGTRNYLAVISNVNCSASVARMIAKRFVDPLMDYPHVDGVISFRHESGCAMAWEGTRHRMLSQVLGGIARHPNIGGCLLVGLGCEQGTLDYLVKSQNLHSIELPSGAGATKADEASSIPVLSIQAHGGTRQTIEHGVELVAKMLPQVNAARRTPQPVSKLILGTECGGSDGYSGITANPALGAAADRIVACGGTVILSETTEAFGAEHLLTRRSRTRAVGEKLLERLEWWKWYCKNYGEELDSNPSVGNKAGGLTTITEKSLGAVAKGGTTALEAVYEYAEPIERSGFVFMDSPGFDPASVTGMAAGGANLIAFTTGRGSCFGFKPVPSFKIASNSRLFARMPEDMDFNAGQVIEGRTVDEVGHELFLQLLAAASGHATCSEKLGIGDEEFVPWLVGPVL